MESLAFAKESAIDNGHSVIAPIVYSWGRSDFGNLFRRPADEDRDGVYEFQCTRTIMTIASNAYHSAAVTSTGELYTCGENDDGQVSPYKVMKDDGSVERDFKRPRILEILGNQQRITSVSCGLTHTVCVTASGCAVSFGGNESGQLGHTPQVISKVPPKIVAFNVTHGHASMTGGAVGSVVIKKAVCGDLYTLFLTTSGEVFGCGSASYVGNPLPAGGAVNISAAQRVECLVGSNVTDIAAGSLHAMVLTRAGEVFSWGSNLHFELGYTCQPEPQVGSGAKMLTSDLPGAQSSTVFPTHQQTPRRVNLAAENSGDTSSGSRDGDSNSTRGRVVGMSLGYHHSVLWTDTGVVLGTGSNKYGQLALPVPRTQSFEVIPLPHTCTAAACGTNHTLVLCSATDSSAATLGDALPVHHTESILYGFGSNNNQQITAISTASMFRTPTVLTTIGTAYGANQVIFVAAGGDQSFAIAIRSPAAEAEANAHSNLLRKQFSTIASKATVAMSAKALIYLLSRAKAAQTTQEAAGRTSPDTPPTTGHGHYKVQPPQPPVDVTFTSALNTASEIFSSPSLLAGSFECSKDSSQAKHQQAVLDGALDRLQWEVLRQQYPAEYPTLQAFASDPTFDWNKVYPKKTTGTANILGNPLLEQRILTKAPLLDIVGIEECYVALMQLGSTANARLLAAMQQTITELEFAATTILASGSLPDSALRVILILWQAPLMASPALSNHLLIRLLRLAAPLADKLQLMCAFYPPHLFVSRLLKPLQAHLKHNIQCDGMRVSEAGDVPVLCEGLRWLYETNKVHHFTADEAYYCDQIDTFPNAILVTDLLGYRQLQDLLQAQQAQQAHTGAKGPATTSPPTPFCISKYPFLISASAKNRTLLTEASILQQHYQAEGARQVLLAGGPVFQPHFIISVERDHLVAQTLIQIGHASIGDLRKPLKIKFVGEEGVDEGGVTKEFFQLLVAQIYSEQYGMFTSAASGRVSVINQHNTWSAAEFNMVGILLGLAAYNSVLLDIHFAPVFYKRLLNMPVSLEDLAAVDPELHKGLLLLLNYSPAAEVEDIFCRSFVVEWEAFGAKCEHELIPDGKNVAVDGNNRYQYVDKLVQWMLCGSTAEQFTALYDGFHKVIHKDAFMLYTAAELQLVMVGMPHLNFQELQLNTEYIGGADWHATNPTVQKFWSIVHSLTLEEKQKFLFFVTGTSKAPIGGLKNIELKIQRMGPHSNSLPTAHTCFNTLLLPEYNCSGLNSRDSKGMNTEEFMRERLLKAISECEGFGLM